MRAFSTSSDQGPLSSCRAQASPCGGFSCCELWALGVVGFHNCGLGAQYSQLPGLRPQDQHLWCSGFIAPSHVGSTWTKDPTCYPCTGRWIFHWVTREVPKSFLNTKSILSKLGSKYPCIFVSQPWNWFPSDQNQFTIHNLVFLHAYVGPGSLLNTLF